jgi:hypothetical protein
VSLKLKAIEIPARMTGYNGPRTSRLKIDGKIEHVVDAAMLVALSLQSIS